MFGCLSVEGCTIVQRRFAYYTGKDETHGIERDNARQRHWLARFRRRTIVVSKTKRMVDVSLALFARFAGNSRISDLLSMLA
jgi:insertion element IS1 protein InsB